MLDPKGGSSTSARRSGCAPGCSPTSARYTPTTRPRGSSTPRTTSPGTTRRASSPPTSASCGRSSGTGPTSTTGGTGPAAPCSSKSPAGRPRESRPARRIGRDDVRCYGPFRSLVRTAEAVRTLNDLLGLRDCAATMPMVFGGQGDLFGSTAPGRLHAPRVRLLHRAVRGIRGRAGVRPAVGHRDRVPGGTHHPADRPGGQRDAGGLEGGSVRGRGALAGEVRAAGMAARRHQPRAHGRGPADVRLSRSRHLRRRSDLPDPAGRRPRLVP